MTEAEVWIKRMLSSNPDLVSENPQWAHLAGGSTNQVRQKSAWRDEDQLMRSVIKHCRQRATDDWRWGLIYHVTNENAHRRPGVIAGIPDLCCPFPCRGYASFYQELKIYGGTLGVDQERIIGLLRAAGNYVEIIWDSQDEALGLFDWYLGESK